jgi:hypothetical protein
VLRVRKAWAHMDTHLLVSRPTHFTIFVNVSCTFYGTEAHKQHMYSTSVFITNSYFKSNCFQMLLFSPQLIVLCFMAINRDSVNVSIVIFIPSYLITLYLIKEIMKLCTIQSFVNGSAKLSLECILCMSITKFSWTK